MATDTKSNLIPFKQGHDERRYTGPGRPSKLDDPDFVELFAKSLVSGATGEELAEAFEIHQRTVRHWKKDPRVKAASYKLINERIVRITSRTDARLDAALNSAEFKELPIDDQVSLLLKVRKEYLGGILRLQAEGGKIDAGTINEAMDELEDNPEFAEELRALMARSGKSNG